MFECRMLWEMLENILMVRIFEKRFWGEYLRTGCW
jgi:hypothetical protein